MESILAKAARLAQGSDPAAALPFIQTLLVEDPRDADALTLQGLVEQRAGSQEKAVAAFAASRDADPRNPARLVNLGLALKGARRFEEAVATLRAADSMRPHHGGTLANLGSCLIAAGRAREAIPVLKNSIRLAPDNAEAANNLGVALARVKDHVAAIAAYNRALTIKPSFIEARLNLADALRATGRLDESAACVHTVLERASDNPRAANLAGILREESGDQQGALAIWQDFLDRVGLSHPIGVNVMRVLIATDRAHEVPDLARQMLKVLPQSTTPLAYLAAALDLNDDYDALAKLRDIEHFVRIIDIAPPVDYPSLDAFHDALRNELLAHSTLTFEPEGLVTRKGRQSGDLAYAKTPALAVVAGLAEAALREFWTDLGTFNFDHPFLTARPDEWSLTLWGTILQPGGLVDPHIHAPNWLSGVYYPGFVHGRFDPDEGAFAIGSLPIALGGHGKTEIIRPRSGRMILFPSFLWHGTLPFGGSAERISFAFDLVPRGIGRPHRL